MVSRRPVFLIAVVTACGRVGFDDALECPIELTEVGRHCYLYEPTMTNWLDAELACEAIRGAHLAVIDDAEEAADVIAMEIPEVIWIGISDRVVEGDYRTVTGQPPYLPWKASFPTSMPDCVEISGSDGELKTLNCDNANQYLCEWDGRASVPANFQVAR